MAVTTTAPVATPSLGAHPRAVRVPMRVKLLAAFAGAFTLVFAFIAVWVYLNAERTATERLTDELLLTAGGGARTISADSFAELVTTVPAVPDPENPSGLGYPDNDLYVLIAKELNDIREVVPEAFVYSYFLDPADDTLYYAASAGYFLDPPFGVTFRQPAADVIGPETYERMLRGLTATVQEPAYTDEFGSWISAFSPITNAGGATVGAIGVDFSLAYVDEVRAEVRERVFPVLIISYLVLLALVVVLSSALVRPLRRLTAAAARIAEGEYDLDLTGIASTRFPDEMHDLGESFAVMAQKVGARERNLTNEVRRLKVEIDATKRAKAVDEITGSDFFSDLTSKAAQMRARMRDDPGPA